MAYAKFHRMTRAQAAYADEEARKLNYLLLLPPSAGCVPFLLVSFAVGTYVPQAHKLTDTRL